MDRNNSGKCRVCKAASNVARVGKPCKKCGSTDRNDSGYCRQCQAERGAAHYAANKEKIVATKATHREERNVRLRERRATDIQFKLADNLRTRLRNAIKSGQKSGSAVRDLGCTIPELKVYLESKFLPGMAWENYGHKGWHIDHIKPLASVDLTDRQQFLEANHYTNLQPLWVEDNYKKRDK